MADAAVGQLAARLPWLAPARRSLLALTDEVPDAAVLARDPATVLLALRYVRPTPSETDVRLDADVTDGLTQSSRRIRARRDQSSFLKITPRALLLGGLRVRPS